MSFLLVNDVTKKFGEKTALKPITLNLNKNEILGVVGHNGAGKTTLFKLILKMYRPDDGEIKFKEKNFHIKNDIGYLPEERGLYGKTDVYSQLIALGYLKGKGKVELKASMEFWLDFFHIEKYQYELLNNLSKGNQQKIQFIAAVIHNPTLLILDEPFSGLDPINVDYFMKAIQLMREKGSTIIYSSHQMDTIELLSDRVLFLTEGRKIHLDTIETIQKLYGYTLKIKNDSLSEKMLLDRGLAFTKKKGVFELSIRDKEEAQFIASHLPNSYSEMFLVERRSMEEIFKLIHQERMF